MTRWKRVHITEDPEWVEFRKMVMSAKNGRCEIHLYLSYSGYWNASLTKMDGNRSAVAFDTEMDSETAKLKALEWAKAA